MNHVNQHSTTIIQFTVEVKKYFHPKDSVLFTRFSISAMARMQIIISIAVKLGIVFLGETSRVSTSLKSNKERKNSCPIFLAYMPKARL